MSEKPILYSFKFSGPGRSVWLVARNIGLELENRDINIRNGDHLTPEFLKMNPQHTIPTLDDNGYYLWDSHAITTYLIDKYANNHEIYPNDLQIRSRIHQRMHFDSSVLFPPLRQCLVAVAFHNACDYPTTSVIAITEAYSLLDRFLENSIYLVGDSLTLADLTCITTVTQLEIVLPIDNDKYKNIRPWIHRLERLPYFTELNSEPMIEVQEWFNSKLASNQTQNKKIN